MESHHRGGNYVNATMPQWYTTESIQAVLALPRADEIPGNREKMARFCLQICHLERCFTTPPRKKNCDDVLALKLYLRML